MQCPNCGQELESAATVCFHCGAAQYPHVPPEPVMRSALADTLLGFAVGIVLVFIGGIGFLVDPILYLVYRRKLPALARGFGYAALIPILMILGLLAVCLVPAIFMSRFSK